MAVNFKPIGGGARAAFFGNGVRTKQTPLHQHPSLALTRQVRTGTRVYPR